MYGSYVRQMMRPAPYITRFVVSLQREMGARLAPIGAPYLSLDEAKYAVGAVYPKAKLMWVQYQPNKYRTLVSGVIVHIVAQSFPNPAYKE